MPSSQAQTFGPRRFHDWFVEEADMHDVAAFDGRPPDRWLAKKDQRLSQSIGKRCFPIRPWAVPGYPFAPLSLPLDDFERS